MAWRAPLVGAPGRAKWCARCAGAHHSAPKRGGRRGDQIAARRACAAEYSPLMAPGAARRLPLDGCSKLESDFQGVWM